MYEIANLAATSYSTRIYNGDGNWGYCHNAVAGDQVTAGIDQIIGAVLESSGYGITRGFAVFDISGIPTGATIDAATITCNLTAVHDSDNDGNDFVAFAIGTPANYTSIAVADFDAMTGGYADNPVTNEIDITGKSSTASTFTINPTGINHLQDMLGNNYVCFVIREGHDFNNDYIGGGLNNQCNTSTVKLNVTYTLPTYNSPFPAFRRPLS